jgi:uncharacterized protein YkwD
MVLLLTACGGGAATATLPAAEPTIETIPPASPTVAVTDTPAAPKTPPSPTVTPVTPVPTNAADCTNLAAFVADVNYQDNTTIEPGQTFTKTWRVQNTGTCIWGPDYTLDYYSGEVMDAVLPVSLALTRPGETLDISLTLTAPLTQGAHRGDFVIKNPAGLIMQIDEDSRLWVIISVTKTVTATPTSIPPTATPTGTPPTATPGSGAAACAFTTDAARLTDVLNAVNAYRAQINLSAYTSNAQLQQAAQKHAADMACNQFFTHTGTDGSTPETRVAAAGYVASSVTENVYGSNPPLSGQDVVAWWATDQADPNHNLNLISTTYSQVGIGYAFFNNYGFYVIVFAAP